MSWPPNPNKKNESSTPNSSGEEWKIIEKTMLASIEEQKKARKWGIFFKSLTFVYIIAIFFVMGSSNSSSDAVNIDDPHIAVIDVNGVISADESANSGDINRAINDAYDNDNVKAVALRINSPGGSPVQSDEIWLNMMEQRKEHPEVKLYAIIGDIGASGAYYIAAAADEIYVNPSSLVGSIGVIMPSYDLQGFMDKVGVQDRTMHAGEYKDILSMGRDMTEFEKKHVNDVLASTHQNFIDAVKEGRGDRLKNPEENKLFSGLFWSGNQAIELGIADKKGGLTQLKKDLELDTAINYTPVDPMEAFFESFAVKMGAGIGSTINLDLAQNKQVTELR